MKTKLDKFQEHSTHVNWSKKQMRKLKHHLPPDGIILKCDFIENLSHIRSVETSQSWFGRRQSQMLSVVVWYWKQCKDSIIRVRDWCNFFFFLNS